MYVFTKLNEKKNKYFVLESRKNGVILIFHDLEVIFNFPISDSNEKTFRRNSFSLQLEGITQLQNETSAVNLKPFLLTNYNIIQH
jgi:hypothetical protein